MLRLLATLAAGSDSRPVRLHRVHGQPGLGESRLKRPYEANDSDSGRRMSTTSEDLAKKVQDLEKAQEVQAATQAGAQATQAATQAGQASTMAAAQAGTWTTVGAAGVALIVGIFLGLAIANSR
jgi:hypothetical protein